MDQGLQFTPVSAALAAERRADRRQPKEVGQAFRRLILPPRDLDFINTCLWKKLSVGAHHKAIWPSVSDRCPFDSSLEDVYHCTKACSWLTIPVRPVKCTFPPVWSSRGRVPIGRLCSDYPQLSLSRAPGILMWKAVRVLWSYRCEVVFQKARLTVNDYLRVLHSEVLKWLAMPDLSLDHEAVRMYAGALQGWLTDRNIPVCEGSHVAGQKRPCPSPQQPDRYLWQQTVDRVSTKRARAAAEEPEGPDVLHVPQAYTNGSFGLEALRTGFAVYGGCGWTRCPRNRILSHAAQDTARAWFRGVGAHCADFGAFWRLFGPFLGHIVELKGTRGLSDTVKSSRTCSVATVSLRLAVLTGFSGRFGPKKAVFGPKLRRFGRAPPNLAPTPRAATGEFLAQNLDLARAPPRL